MFQEIKSEMQTSLSNIVHRTAQHLSDFSSFQSDANNKETKQIILVELVQMLFEQFKSVAQAHSVLLNNFARAAKAHNVDLKLYDMNFYWIQLQAVFQSFLNDYLDVQNISAESQLNTEFTNTSDISSFFSRRKPQRYLWGNALHFIILLWFSVAAKRRRCLSLTVLQVHWVWALWKLGTLRWDLVISWLCAHRIRTILLFCSFRLCVLLKL